MSVVRIKKNTLRLGLLICAIAIILIVLLFPRNASTLNTTNAITFEKDAQIITVSAKGGYFPATITAKANHKTILRVVTKGTFDCSSSLMIPKIGYKTFLPSSGSTDIEIPPQNTGENIIATCSMGMYGLTINFR
jgi:plastocyanin domain-containing protein